MNTGVCNFGVIICLCFLMSFTGCSEEKNDPNSTTQQKETPLARIHTGGIYRLPLDITPTTFDPPRIEDYFGVSVANQVFDGLVQYGPYLNILPAVAEDWKIEDNGKTLRFYLRKDVTFHDNTPVTARDAAFSIRRLFRIEPAPSILPHFLYIKGSQPYREGTTDSIEGVTVVNDHELLLHLDEPYAPLLRALAMYQAVIVPEHIISGKSLAFSQSPVGCGPFKFINWQPDQMIRLERFPDYYSGASYFDAIEYHIYPGAQRDRVLADFQKGRLDEMPVFGSARQELAQTENLHWVHRPSLSLLFYGINMDHSLLKDPRLRKALSLAVNRQELVKTVYNNQFEAARTVLPPGMPAHNREAILVEKDIAKARELISEVTDSQAIDSLKVEIASASKSAFAQAEFDFISKSWRRIGVTASIKYITNWSDFEKYLHSDSMQLYRYSWTADMPDPDNFLRPLFATDSTVNFGDYTNPEIDYLIKDAASMIDDVERAQLYQKIEKNIMLEHPVIPLFYLSIDRVYHSKVRGIQSSPLGWQAVRLHRTWFEPQLSQ